MARVIISTDGGVLLDVHTDASEPIQYLMVDEQDKFDDIRAPAYMACERLLQAGFLTACSEIKVPVHLGETAADAPGQENMRKEDKGCPQLGTEGFDLICDDNQADTGDGKILQKLDAAFVNGYLAASAELSSFIGGLFRAHDPRAADVYTALRLLLDRQSDNYFVSCARINDRTLYEEN